jgi:hypothetical protein
MRNIVERINSFTAAIKELVLVKLSSSKHLDRWDAASGDDKEKGEVLPTIEGWATLLDILNGTYYLMTGVGATTDLGQWTVKDYLNSGTAAVVYIIDDTALDRDSVDLASYPRGFIQGQ